MNFTPYFEKPGAHALFTGIPVRPVWSGRGMTLALHLETLNPLE